MKPINRFTLEKHDGPYEKWPLRSCLFLDGKPTDLSLPGYELLHQFETSDGYILITDYDCPFEEITNFAFISKHLRLISCRWLGWMYETFLLERIEWIDERTFIAVIGGSDTSLAALYSLVGHPVHPAPIEASVLISGST